MRELIKYFIRYEKLANVLIILFFILGYIGLTRLKSNYFPEVPSRNISVRAVYPGASPEEIEKGVVLKIEDNLKGMTGVERVSSVSQENAASINVEVEKGFDTDLIVQDVKNAVDRISNFPVGMEPVAVYKLENLGTAVSFAIYGSVDLRQLKLIAESVENDLRSVPGISKIEVAGFPEREIEVSLRESDLRAFRLTSQQIAAAIRGSNVDITGGTIRGEQEEMLIRAKDKRYFAEELKEIVVKATEQGQIVRLRDVAEVKDKWEDVPQRSFYNGRPSVVLTVQNTVDEDILFIADTVKSYISHFNLSRQDVQASIIRDSAVVLQERIDLLVENGVIGLILVLILLALFLNHRLAFWVALSIPISFAGMLIFASLFDITINVMSLFGMIIVIGILVDDGIVICENIYQHYERGESALKAAINGTMEVLPAVFSAIVTTVIAFSTFFFVDGRLGDFARELAFVVIFTLIFSLVEGALILPAHVAHSRALAKDDKPNRFQRTMNGIMNYLKDKLYEPVLRFSIQNSPITVSTFIVLLILSFGLVAGGFVKGTFFPPIELDTIAINLKMPSGTIEKETQKWLDHIEKSVWEVNEELKSERKDESDVILAVDKRVSDARNVGSLSVILLGAEERNMANFEVSNLLREKAGVIPGAEQVTFGGSGGFGKPISISLRSNNIQEMQDATEELKAELAQLSSVRDIEDNDQEGIREIKIKLKDKAYLLGLTVGEVLAQVRQGFFGNEAQRLQRGLDELKVWVRYDSQDRSSKTKLEEMRIRLIDGREFPLSELADFSIERGTMAINHLDGQREIKIQADLANPNMSATDIYADIEKNIIPEFSRKYSTLSYSFEGQAKQSEKTVSSIGRAAPIILLLMLFTILFTFRSFIQTFIVVITIPFGLIGVIAGHWVHGVPTSLLSFFGLIALIGIMVNDSLVFINTYNNFLKRGLEVKEAIYQTGLSRFRPILLTSITTIAGLGPIILKKSFGAQFLIPMAITVAYGLMIALFLTLLLIPSLLIMANTFRFAVWRVWWGTNPELETLEPAVKEMKFENEEF